MVVNDPKYFNRDYFERGIETGLSCYQNYRWIPELTIPLAMTIIDYLEIKRGQSILDFGCAKGFLVKAFRMLYREAQGLDVSIYAIENCDSEVKEYCFIDDNLISEKEYDFCVAKDVFEHMLPAQIVEFLLRLRSDVLFVVVPLGNGRGIFTAAPNNLDKTHVICQTMDWWENFFREHPFWELKESRYRIEGIKDSYHETYPKGHGFFRLHKVS